MARRSAAEILRETLEDLSCRHAICSDGAQAFALRKEIELAEAALAELSRTARPRPRGSARAGEQPIGPHDPELQAASRERAGHALTLALLGRYLARTQGGDIRRRDTVADMPPGWSRPTTPGSPARAEP
jgi:hypothetical protein